MAEYPSTGSILDNEDLGSKTRTGLSTQILIYVNEEPVGAVQSFTENQTKGVRRIGEVGTDGFIEIIPNIQTTIALELERVVFDGLSLPESLSRGFRNIAAQRIPFDVVVVDKFTGSGDNAVVTTYHNCWFERISKSYTATDYVIVERAGVAAQFMSTVRGGEAVSLSQGVGGAREIPDRQEDSVEQAADAGKNGRRGSLDFPGLITAAF